MKRLLILLLFWSVCGTTLRAAQAPVQPEKYRPQWQIGQQWVVQTESRQQQAAVGRQKVVTARWQFRAEAVEQVQGQACIRIAVRPFEGRQIQQEPKTTVWIDRTTSSIRQIQVQLPTRKGYKTVTESYKPDQEGAPVIGPLSVLPIAMPQFAEEGIKAIGTYHYNTISGAGGIKALGQIGFTTEIRQVVSRPAVDLVESLQRAEGIKGFMSRELVEVNLSTPDDAVQQLWSTDTPWPLFTDNGTTKATLIEIGARPNRQPRPRRDLPPVGNLPAAGEGVKALNPAGATEEALATIQPWSGYWWPIHEGRLLEPLGKYDTVTGHRAADWERQNNPPGPEVPQWHGYCHAWAAASVLEKEPTKDQMERSVALSVGDQKGLLTACHTEDLANSWGDRFGDGEGSENPMDLRPDRVWHLLQMHLGQQEVPLIMDVEAGEEVWNYPIYGYSIRYQPAGSGRFVADLVLLMADDAVSPSYRGTKVRKQTYQFTFKMRDGNVVKGSGKWAGESREDHPDFAWYPYKAVATNPEIAYRKVLRLVSAETTTPSAAPVDDPSTEPAPSTMPSGDPSDTSSEPSAEPEPPTTPAEPTVTVPATESVTRPPATDPPADTSTDPSTEPAPSTMPSGEPSDTASEPSAESESPTTPAEPTVTVPATESVTRPPATEPAAGTSTHPSADSAPSTVPSDEPSDTASEPSAEPEPPTTSAEPTVTVPATESVTRPPATEPPADTSTHPSADSASATVPPTAPGEPISTPATEPATTTPALPTAPPSGPPPGDPEPPTTPPTPSHEPPTSESSDSPTMPVTTELTVQEVVEPATGPVVLSPLELAALIANKTSSFEFDAMLDRYEGASYRPGESFFVRVKSEKAGYLYLLQVDSTGTPSLLHPAAGEDNRILGGKLVDIKPNDPAGGFPVMGPAGIVRVKALVTSRPLVFSGSLDAVQAQQRRVCPVQFRWHPTQQRQIKQLLVGGRQISSEQIGCRPPQDILGAFAQDMTTFYIDHQPPISRSESENKLSQQESTR